MSELESTLEEERRIINAATAGPWEWRDDQYPGQLIRRVYLGDPMSDDWMKRGEVHPMNVLKCGDWLATDGDAEFIAHARTALPLRNAQVEAVYSLHQREVRWQINSYPELSFETFAEAEDMAEGPEEEFSTFELCIECRRIEDGPSGVNAKDVGYESALYPCATVRAIEEAGA